MPSTRLSPSRLIRTVGIAALAAFLVACRAAPQEAGVHNRIERRATVVEELLARMTLAEKIGQMTQAELSSIQDPAVIAELHLGSVLSGGGSDPAAGNSREAWTAAVESFQKAALGSRLGIPLLYGVDAVHGHNNVIGAVIFPHNIGLGATGDSALVRRVAEVTAEEMRATAVNWTFAPAVTVPRDERWGRTYEGFSEDPQIVSDLGAAAVRGYQRGGRLDDPLAVLATAKHYLGDGGTVPGTGGFGNQAGLDQGDMPVSEAEMRRVHLFPYRAVVAEGVGSIMPSYSSWNGTKMSGSRTLLTDVLKGELGFGGFLISDYNAIQQLGPDFKTDIARSINAGMDMAMVPQEYRRFIELLTEAVNEGLVPESRIDDAVRRILRVKAAMGLLDEGASPLADPALATRFGSAEHRALAREAVRKSLVLLKNEGGRLPLGKDLHRIHVAGPSADDIGRQSGGWTIDWQGGEGAMTTGGTTILEAIRAAAGPGTEVTWSADGAGAEGADVAVAVVGEPPYAEGFGDRTDLALDARQVELIRRLDDAGVPVVTVLVAGRPMILGDVLERSDAWVVAWLPGTEGEGVADVLFGAYAPTGTLAFSWPRSMEQLPINVGDADYDPLFPLGFGLTW